MPKICIVTHFFPPHMGGIEKVSYEQSRRLANLGYDIDILTSIVREQNSNPHKGVRVFGYPSLNLAEKFGIPYPILTAGAYKIFTKVIRKCDLVHAHGHVYLSSYLASKLAKKYNKPIVGNSDSHSNETLDYTFSMIDAKKDVNSVISAIKQNKIKIVTQPLSNALFIKIAFTSTLIGLLQRLGIRLGLYYPYMNR